MTTIGFDLDLTLCDTRPGIIASFAALSAETGVAVDGALIVTRLGPKLETELANWFPPEQITDAAAIYRRHYERECRLGTTALPGTTELLGALRRLGVQIVVVTAKSTALAAVCLDVAGLPYDDVVGWVHGLEKGEALRAAAAIGYVGDTAPDMHAARAAQCIGVGVTTGPDDAATLLEAGAHIVVADLTDTESVLSALGQC